MRAVAYNVNPPTGLEPGTRPNVPASHVSGAALRKQVTRVHFQGRATPSIQVSMIGPMQRAPCEAG